MTETPEQFEKPVAALGERFLNGVRYFGGMGLLLGEATAWTLAGLFTRRARFRWGALAKQMVRVGVRSTGIVALVTFFLGVILALQMAPTMEPYGQLPLVADIIGWTVFRELGPLVAAVVLSGFAGASIAAELGTMVVSEEIEALRAHAMNPVGFLVVPRLLATTIMLICLAIVANMMASLGGYVASVAVLGTEASAGYWDRIGERLANFDFITGLVKAGLFGMLISLIACHEGLRVRGGAEGVGKATTMTVVYSIVALVAVDCIFTVILFLHEPRLRDVFGA